MPIQLQVKLMSPSWNGLLLVLHARSFGSEKKRKNCNNSNKHKKLQETGEEKYPTFIWSIVLWRMTLLWHTCAVLMLWQEHSWCEKLGNPSSYCLGNDCSEMEWPQFQSDDTSLNCPPRLCISNSLHPCFCCHLGKCHTDQSRRHGAPRWYGLLRTGRRVVRAMVDIMAMMKISQWEFLANLNLVAYMTFPRMLLTLVLPICMVGAGAQFADHRICYTFGKLLTRSNFYCRHSSSWLEVL